MRPLSLLLALSFTACAAEVDEDSVPFFPEAAATAGRADEAGALQAFAGKYRLSERPPGWNAVPTSPNSGQWLFARADGDELTVALHYKVGEDDHWVAAISGPVGGEPEVDTYTVSLQDVLSLGERRRIVKTRVWLDERTVEERTEMYDWPVSIRVWEDWRHDGTLVRRVRLTDDGLEYTSYESQRDDAEHRVVYRRHE